MVFFLMCASQDNEKRLKYVKFLEEQLGIEKPEQWENVSRFALKKVKMPYSWRYLIYFCLYSNYICKCSKFT